MMEKASSLDIDRRDAENIDRIRMIKKSLGARLVILGHYYQRLSIALLSDHLGDSYGLSSLSARSREARYIVFCGVEFMAESAEILRTDQQTVYHPHSGAGCPMADMAALEEVERAYHLLESATGKKVIPITYMNSSSEVKAFCGRMGGLVCTSSNARNAFQWAFERGDAILFVPDEHLGINTADRLDIPEDERAVYDPSHPTSMNQDTLHGKTRVLLWKGHCHVHTWFSADDVRQARELHPEARIVVHPECPREIVTKADLSGSTAFMERFVREAPAGSTTVIGTEINLIEYLRHKYGAEKTILPLSRSFCPNMYKINLRNLRETLEHLDTDRFQVRVDAHVKTHARVALERMLEVA